MLFTRFAGRESERGAIGEWLREAAEGRSRMALVSGDPGIGKTRLLQECADAARNDGFAVAWGACWDGAGTPPFWPWAQLLKDLGDSTVHQPERNLAWLAQPAAASVPESAGLESRFRQFEAVAAFLREVSVFRPLFLILDDLHWSDPGSVALLEFVARDLLRGGARILLVAAFRDIELPVGSPFERILSRTAQATIALEGLNAGEAAAFAALNAPPSADTPPFDTAAIELLLDETAGNPFLLSELLAQGSTQAFQPAPSTSLGAARVVSARIERLTEEARAVLRLAAVMGRDFSGPMLAGAAPVAITKDRPPAARIASLLGEAEQLRLIAAVEGKPGDFRFVHALTRDALYTAIPRDERMRLHEVAGQTLEAAGAEARPGMLSVVAHHYHEAAALGDYGRAALAAMAAAAESLRCTAYEQAAELFEMAARTAERAQPAEIDQLGAALLGRADCLRRLGDRETAEETCLELAALGRRCLAAQRPEGAGLLAEAALMWRLIRRGQDTLEGDPHGLVEEAFRAMPQALSSQRLRIVAERAYLLFMRGNIREARELTSEAISQAQDLGDALILGRVLTVAQLTLFGAMTEAERLAMAAQLLDVAQQTGDSDFEFAARTARVVLFANRGETEDLRLEIASYARLAERGNRAQQRWSATYWGAALALFEGRMEDALQVQEAALAIGTSSQARNAPIVFASQRLLAFREIGRISEIYPMMKALSSGFAEHAAWRAALAYAAVDIGLAEDARRSIAPIAAQGFVLHRDALWSSAVAMLTETICDLGEREWAATLLEAARNATHGRFSVFGEVSAIGASWSYYLGRLQATTGEVESASTSLERAEREAREAGAPLWMNYARAHRAALLAQWAASSEMMSQARALLESVREDAAAMGYVRLLRLAESILVPDLTPRQANPAGLTAREIEVLRLVIAQHTNREIAEILGLSVHTVIRHVDNVLRKTNATNRAEAARWATARGL